MYQGGRALLIAVSILAASVLAVAGEDVTVHVTAAWEGQGRLFKVHDTHALFAGTFRGQLVVETQPNLLDAATLVCPGLIEVHRAAATLSGEGRCLITTRTNETVYASWQCTGVYPTGCQGTFTLLGGTGPFARMTGRSAFLLRSDLTAYVADLPSMTDGIPTAATGVAIWPALTYTLP